MLVHKFGGTSVADATRLLGAAKQVLLAGQPAVVVTSAMAGVTDELIALAGLASERRTGEVESRQSQLKRRHLQAAEELTDQGASRESLLSSVTGLILDLEQLLHGVRLLQELTPRSLDLIQSFGERLAAPLFAAALRRAGANSEAVDAREILRTDASFGRAVVDHEHSRVVARERLLSLAQSGVPVVTGFIAATVDGLTTTLGRGGSDYSASLIGAYLDAREIWIWTDVDGVMTADPRVVPEARILDVITYREAAEMAYFGSKVLHPSTMTPAVRANIPLRIRNSLRPEVAGTRITGQRDETAGGVKTVTSISDMALVTVEGRGMIGVPGVVGRVFSATARAGINVLMISQASSEQNISFLVRRDDGKRAREELSQEFELELSRRRIDRIDVKTEVAILAIIGEGMRGTPGISQKLFSALGRARINVLAIAQGSSELNVSVVVAQADLHRAVGAVHTAFGLTHDTHVFLLGKGLIGRTLLRQLVEARDRLLREHGLSLKVVGVAGRSSWLHQPAGIPDETLRRVAAGEALESLGGSGRPDDTALLDALSRERRLDTVLVDITAEETGPLHLAALQRGLHVVTANKKPLSGELSLYHQIRRTALEQGVGYHHETTFGAGLPVLFTLQDLLATCDRVEGIVGCFSGTLGFVCSGLQAGRPLSEIVVTAKEKGYTEPDPRDDLSGLDVARKALIIARELGLDLEMSQVQLEGMLPAEAMALPDVESFMRHLPSLDSSFATRVERARQRGKVLRYTAEIGASGVKVGLSEVDTGSALGQLSGPDNIVIYRTERYRENPLIIRGPGAGAEVTSAGVFGDILKIARRT
ncbi:MAG: bifunctional aspartate kinase/homoserine dehydrogenase I [Pseudomonadota bacterium]